MRIAADRRRAEAGEDEGRHRLRPSRRDGRRRRPSVDIERSPKDSSRMSSRLMLLGEAVSEFVNQRPIPGLMFSWGPVVQRRDRLHRRDDGHLMLLDQKKHKQTVAGVKDALLPAWSMDGTRLAWVQKTARKKYSLVWALGKHRLEKGIAFACVLALLLRSPSVQVGGAAGVRCVRVHRVVRRRWFASLDHTPVPRASCAACPWSPDGRSLHVQTIEARPPASRLHRHRRWTA